VAGGFLTKWTAPAFFYLAALSFLWQRGRLRLLLGRGHLVSAALAAGLCLAWVAAVVATVGWAPFRDTVGREALTKLWPGARHRLYPALGALLHPLSLLVACLPWSAVALLTLRPGFAALWDGPARRLLQLLHAWTWPNLLFWSLIPGHSARHSFPLVPGLAGLAAFVWVAWLAGRLRWRVPVVSSRGVLVGLLVLWLLVKLAFVHVVVPERGRLRQPRAKGELVAALVPPGETLYLFRVKDEGILFYYGRPARRLAGPEDLPRSGELVYCIVTESEWGQWPARRPAAVLGRLDDEQGDGLLVLRVGPVPVRRRACR
jgi:hypothetical protein